MEPITAIVLIAGGLWMVRNHYQEKRQYEGQKSRDLLQKLARDPQWQEEYAQALEHGRHWQKRTLERLCAERDEALAGGDKKAAKELTKGIENTMKMTPETIAELSIRAKRGL